MTEDEWLACTDPTPMWDVLWDKGSNRKRQLFACACCRRIWYLLINRPEPFRYLVELSEQAADGLVFDERLEDAWPYTELDSSPCGVEGLATLAATGVSVRWDYQEAQQFAAAAATGQSCYYDLDPTIPAVAIELKAQTNLLRCILGNPFRPITIPPVVLAWNDGIVLRIAEGIYKARQMPEGTLDNTHLAILADALEEAGCTNADVLAHCRQPGEHVRGCWVVDLILGKE